MHVFDASVYLFYSFFFHKHWPGIADDDWDESRKIVKAVRY